MIITIEKSISQHLIGFGRPLRKHAFIIITTKTCNLQDNRQLKIAAILVNKLKLKSPN